MTIDPKNGELVQRLRNKRYNEFNPAILLRRRQNMKAIVFWNSQGVIKIDHLQRTKALNDSLKPNNWGDSKPKCRNNGLIIKEGIFLSP